MMVLSEEGSGSAVKMEQRRQRIVELVNKEGNVSFSRLKAQFNPISEMTLRRDLEYLDQAGRVIRVHGGAKSVEVVIGTDDLLLKRSVRNMEAKELIAQKAAELLRVNTAVFLDSGSTATLLARQVPDDRYMIFTSGISCVQELLRLSQAQIHVVGGKVNRASQSTCSSKSLGYLDNINFQTAFLGVTGFTLEHGFTCGTEDECELKRAVIRNTDVVVALMDSSKIGVGSTFTYAMPEEVNVVVSDGEMDRKTRQVLEDAGVTVL